MVVQVQEQEQALGVAVEGANRSATGSLGGGSAQACSLVEGKSLSTKVARNEGLKLWLLSFRNHDRDRFVKFRRPFSDVEIGPGNSRVVGFVVDFQHQGAADSVWISVFRAMGFARRH